MAKPSPRITLPFLLYLVVLSPPYPTEAFVSYTQITTVLSLSHSLFSRVANLRASRGDFHGARRAQLIADKLEHVSGLRFWSNVWSMGWDYLKNYAWRDTMSFRDALGFASDINELLSSLSQFGHLRSDSERAAWIARNYSNFFRISKSMFSRFSSIFSKSGPLRELVETLQKEIEGEFLKDCLQVGAGDLMGLVQILKDLASQYTDGHQEL
ncbi:unnamed protein product [Amaranthus hypochondriacus]